MTTQGQGNSTSSEDKIRNPIPPAKNEGPVASNDQTSSEPKEISGGFGGITRPNRRGSGGWGN
jgi:hypothetical protein